MKNDSKNIIFHPIVTKSEINVLLNQKSFNNGFLYKYDQGTVNLLKRNFDRKNSYYLIARQNDNFVAFVSADTDWREDNHLFIREIFVSPAFQRLGFGRSLMKKCIEHARGLGMKTVVTETAFKNTAMQKNCENLGFIKWNNPEWSDGITYKLQL